MQTEIFDLYKQIINFYNVWFTLKQFEDNPVKKNMLVGTFNKEMTKLSEAFVKAFPDDNVLALELDSMVTHELSNWSIKRYIEEPDTNFLAHMIPLMNEKIQETYDEYEYEYEEE